MKHTLRERLEAGLIALGYNQVESKTRKATTWQKEDEGDYLYFVGRKGSLRVGLNYTHSWASLNVDEVLSVGDNALAHSEQKTP